MTESEKILTEINSSIFFKEFTYATNELNSPGGETKELADNVVWLDELLIVYQVKGREEMAIVDMASEEKWFEKKVATHAKKQIRDTISFFKNYNSLPIINERGQKVDIAEAKVHQLVKVIIYDPKSNHLDPKRELKFLESTTAGLIHLFHIEDYAFICKYLVTPAELADYLYFREKIYLLHRTAITARRENYLIGHFLTTPDTVKIDDSYIKNIEKIDNHTSSFDISWILNNFFDRLVMYSKGKETDYHYIIREIAKLNREELKAFNERYYTTIEQVQTNTFGLPLRFASLGTKCGFVFITLQLDKAVYWENALLNTIDKYKYKHQLLKCVGVVIYKDKEYFQINWSYSTGAWEYNAELEKAVIEEDEFYAKSQVKLLPRYPLTF